MKNVSRVQMLRAVKPEGVTLLQAADVLERLGKLVTEEARAGRRVHLAGFGTFVLGIRKGRIIRNPQTKQLQHIAATKTVLFRASKWTKAAVSR